MHPGVLEAIIAHARALQPAECCGMLIGRPDEIVEAIRARNLAESPNRFFIDPKDHINARRYARASGLEVVGFYHSHPHSEAMPSSTDLAEASYPHSLYLIVSLQPKRPVARLFRLDDDRFVELPFEVDATGH